MAHCSILFLVKKYTNSIALLLTLHVISSMIFIKLMADCNSNQSISMLTFVRNEDVIKKMGQRESVES